MSYGHAENIARRAGTPPPIPPEVWERPEMRAALAGRDIGRVYKLLKQDGISQREIARRTGQSQSEVSEILKGRQVRDVTVLERIADGLGVPRPFMRLLEHVPDDGAYPGREAPQSGTAQEVADDMLRRDALALGSLAAFGQVIVGTLAGKIPYPGGCPLPSRLGMTDIAEIAGETERLRAAARAAGGQARNAVAVAAHFRQLTQVPATEAVAKSLGSELAELHELAGWCCFDSGLANHARWHYRTAVDLAHRVGDDYRVASAVRCAGLVEQWSGHLNDAVKYYQMAHFKLGTQDPDLSAWLHAVSAGALVDMGHEQAPDHLAKARDGWQATEASERADQNYQSALVYARLGRLDLAEQLTASIKGAGRVRPVGVLASVLRATLHVQTGEPRGLLMAKSAIDAVAPLRSVRARERLQPLAAALEARSGSDARELARQARQVVATRT
jgi:transcriptional regulator with XRE-family HTH domain